MFTVVMSIPSIQGKSCLQFMYRGGDGGGIEYGGLEGT